MGGGEFFFTSCSYRNEVLYSYCVLRVGEFLPASKFLPLYSPCSSTLVFSQSSWKWRGLSAVSRLRDEMWLDHRCMQLHQMQVLGERLGSFHNSCSKAQPGVLVASDNPSPLTLTCQQSLWQHKLFLSAVLPPGHKVACSRQMSCHSSPLFV